MTFDEIKNTLSHFTVGIAGCGGLGSNCAVALTRVGIGKLIIADFDIVVESNLNRQFFFIDQLGQKKTDALLLNLKRINPDVTIDAHDMKLGPDDILSIYEDCDIIVEAFDRADMKEMLIETVLTGFPEKSLVVGSGIAGWGGNNHIKTKQTGNLYLIGDEESEVSENLPPLGPRVGIAANMQANVVLEILLRKDKAK